VFGIARAVVKDHPDDQLQAAIELLDKDGHLISDITRHHIAEALDGGLVIDAGPVFEHQIDQVAFAGHDV
jgi:hypothetical protein